MLNRKPAVLLAAVVLALSAGCAFADDGGLSYGSKIAGKFGLGLINATTGIAELPKSMMVESAAEGIGMGMTVGLLKGMTNMLGRSLFGMLDVVSFPIPTKPMLTPPVVFQDFDTATTYGDGWETY
ncbi:MAG: exosortase system-associated protein, TIGR04073 family [Candidatus Methylumidiphilus sp.]